MHHTAAIFIICLCCVGCTALAPTYPPSPTFPPSLSPVSESAPICASSVASLPPTATVQEASSTLLLCNAATPHTEAPWISDSVRVALVAKDRPSDVPTLRFTGFTPTDEVQVLDYRDAEMVVWSPNSRWLLLSNRHHLQVLSTHGTVPIDIRVADHEHMLNIVWAPDSTQLAFGYYTTHSTFRIGILSLATGQIHYIDAAQGEPWTRGGPLMWAPTSDMLAFGQGTRLSLIDPITDQVHLIDDGSQISCGDSVADITWSPNAEMIARRIYNGAGGQSWCMMVNTRDGTPIPVAVSGKPSHSLWSANSQHLYFLLLESDWNLYSFDTVTHHARRLATLPPAVIDDSFTFIPRTGNLALVLDRTPPHLIVLNPAGRTVEDIVLPVIGRISPQLPVLQWSTEGVFVYFAASDKAQRIGRDLSTRLYVFEYPSRKIQSIVFHSVYLETWAVRPAILQ